MCQISAYWDLSLLSGCNVEVPGDLVDCQCTVESTAVWTTLRVVLSDIYKIKIYFSPSTYTRCTYIYVPYFYMFGILRWKQEAL